MAMLAEPRRKTKWTLNPRGKLWSEDSNKFGQKLLEKMGWKAGKGLGAKEQGMTSHIHVQVKSDNTGVGFKGKDTDWCKHQAQFDEVLASLSENMGGIGNSQPSGSLEERSKASKARLHYHKFTREKDVSKYSSKDLSCILGVPGKKIQENNNEGLCPVEDVGAEDDSFGVKTIVGGSIEDYLNRKKGLNKQEWVLERKDAAREGSCGKKRKKRGSMELPLTLEFAGGNEDVECPNVGEVEPKRKKKKKKSKSEEEGEVKRVGSVSEPVAGAEESEFPEGNLQNFSAELEGVGKRECKTRKKSSERDSRSNMKQSEIGICGGSDEGGFPQSRIKKKKRKAEFSGRVLEGEAGGNVLSKEGSGEGVTYEHHICNERVTEEGAPEERDSAVKKKKKRVKVVSLCSNVDEICGDLGSSNGNKSKEKKSSAEENKKQYLDEGRVLLGEMEQGGSSKEASVEDVSRELGVCNESIAQDGAKEESYVVKKRKKCVKVDSLGSNVDEMCSDLGRSKGKKSKKKKSSDFVGREKYPCESVNGDAALASDTHVCSSSVKQVVGEEVRFEEIESSVGMEKQVKPKKKKGKCNKLEKQYYYSCLDSKECDSETVQACSKLFVGANLNEIQGYGAGIE